MAEVLCPVPAQDVGALLLADHVVEVHQDPDVAEPHLLRKPHPLGEGVDDIAVGAAHRLDGDGDAMGGGCLAGGPGHLHHLPPGRRGVEAVRHALGPGAAKDDDFGPQLRGALQRAGVIRPDAAGVGLGPGEAEAGREEVVAGLTAQAARRHSAAQGGKLPVAQRHHLCQGQLDVVVAQSGDLFRDLHAGPVGAGGNQAAAASESHRYLLSLFVRTQKTALTMHSRPKPAQDQMNCIPS